MRQTLLPFLSIPRKRQETVATIQLGSPCPAPEIPTEVWDIILGELSTIALKTLRLVCRSWSRVGSDRLFQTIYLDSYELSWKRFEQLAASKYAQLATSIVWTPVVLYENCLDGEIWRSKYPNLLHGLSHSESLRFHELFSYTYAETRLPNLPLPKYVDRIQEGDLNDLVNCHRLIIADDSDIETKCADEHFRRRIQSDPMLLKKPAVWGRHPQWWLRCSENSQVLDTVSDIFRLVQQTPAISQVKVSMWDQHIDPLLDYLRQQLYSECLSCIRSFDLQLKFCTVINVELEHSSARSIMKKAFTTLSNLRNLQNIVFEPIYTNAGCDFIKFYKQRQKEEQLYDETYDDVSDSTSRASRTSTIYSSASALDGTSGILPDGLTRDFLGPYEAVLNFPMARFQQLKSLTLCNVTVNTKALMAWLCNQSQLPESCLTLQLKGPTILHGPCPHIFLQVLAQLSVKLTYEARSTIWYSIDPLDTTVDHHCIEWGDHVEYELKESLYCTIDMWSGLDKWMVYHYPENRKPQQMPEQMPEQGTTRVQSSPSAAFVHRPLTIKEILATIDDKWSAKTFLYCLVRGRDQQYSFEWLNESEYNSSRARFVSGESEVEAIMAARACTHQGYDEYDPAHYHYLMQEEFYEEEDQAALLLYENELFRWDLFDTTGDVLLPSSGAASRE